MLKGKKRYIVGFFVLCGMFGNAAKQNEEAAANAVSVPSFDPYVATLNNCGADRSEIIRKTISRDMGYACQVITHCDVSNWPQQAHATCDRKNSWLINRDPYGMYRLKKYW